MAIVRNTAEGGTNGTAVTTGNSGGGSGSAFTFIGGAGASRSIIFSTAQFMHGSLSYDMSVVAGDTILPEMSFTSSPQCANQFYFRLPVLPSATVTIAQLRNASGNAAKIAILATNKLNIQDATGTTLHTFPTVLLANTWYRVELEAIPGTTTANGTINGGYYLGDTTEGSPVDARYASGAAVNAGTVNLTKFQPGIAQCSATGTFHVFYDDVAYDSTTSAPWGAGAATVPGAPTAIVPTPSNSGVSVAFTAPASNGGSAITGYNITVTDTVTSNVFTNSGPVSPIFISGLTNGNLCSVTVDAVNAIGTGPESLAATFTPAAVPGAPTSIVASAGVGAASVAFTAPASNGGSPITNYVATSTPGSFTGAGSASPINVLGLTVGTGYTFTVHATNAIGDSVESAASNSVTPTTGLNAIKIRRSGVWESNVPVKIRRSAAWTQVL